MITLYGSPTPNSRKITIALEEMAFPWSFVHVDMLNGDQLTPEFLKLNPNNKTPVIRDDEGPGEGPFVLWESGAILWYLAEKSGRFLPADPARRAICQQWIMFQVSGIGPMFGQYAHFASYLEEKHPYPIARYTNERDRLLRVVDRRLAESAYFAGEDYSIADICIYPYVMRSLDAAKYPHLQRWADLVGARPAVRRGLDFLVPYIRPETNSGGRKVRMSTEQASILWGDRQFAIRRDGTS